ncbi:hypothetical protein HanLR1_Chr12g0438281 [Helianthus annuus]|nr:hypothetical protein HanLR1_Chr12g0438281 [Helianthus annuus]
MHIVQVYLAHTLTLFHTSNSLSHTLTLLNKHLHHISCNHAIDLTPHIIIIFQFVILAFS